jgi:hypothetical protein
MRVVAGYAQDIAGVQGEPQLGPLGKNETKQAFSQDDGAAPVGSVGLEPGEPPQEFSSAGGATMESEQVTGYEELDDLQALQPLNEGLSAAAFRAAGQRPFRRESQVVQSSTSPPTKAMGHRRRRDGQAG